MQTLKERPCFPAFYTLVFHLLIFLLLNNETQLAINLTLQELNQGEKTSMTKIKNNYCKSS